MMCQQEALAVAGLAANEYIQRLQGVGEVCLATTEFFNACVSVGLQALEALEPGRWNVSASADDGWRTLRLIVEQKKAPPEQYFANWPRIERVREEALAERARIVKHIRECAALPSMRAHRPEVAEALAALATEIEEGEHTSGD